MLIKKSAGERAFNVINTIFMIFMILITLYPLLYVVFASFSESNKLMANVGLLWKPLGFSTQAYKKVLENPAVPQGFINSVFLVVVGSSVNIIMTCIGAYVLSRKNLYWKPVMMVMVVVTMYFNGGLIPNFLLIRDLKMLDTFFALLIPGAISTFNLIIMRAGFMAIPDSLEESAKLDGAGNITILARIIVPLAMPTIAVIILYYSVGHWNAWFNSMIYITDRSKFPLQLVLRQILILNDTASMQADSALANVEAVGETIKYALIVLSSIPMLIVYPFLQRHFIKGVMIGALKG